MNGSLLKKMIATALGLLWLLSIQSTWAAKFRIDQIDAARFPAVKLYTSLTNDAGKPVTDLKEEDVKLLEDGVPSKAKLKLTSFQFKNERIAIVMIIGASGIMKGQPLEYEKKAIVKSMKILREKDMLSVVAFGDRVEIIAPLGEDREESKKSIRSLKTFGNAVNFYDALYQAIEALSKPGLPTRKAIIVVADGRDNGSTQTREELIEEIKSKNIPIYGIGYTLLGPRHLVILKKLVKISGGTYFYAKNGSQISGLFQKILLQIQKGYVHEVKVKHIKGDTRPHQLTLVAKIGKQELSSTKIFKAERPPGEWWERVLKIAIWVLIAALLIGILVWYFIAPIPGYKRKCPICKQVMKDEWEECLFCKYTPLYEKDVLKTKR